MAVFIVSSLVLIVILSCSPTHSIPPNHPTYVSHGAIIQRTNITKFILGHLTIDLDLRIPYHAVHELYNLRAHVETTSQKLQQLNNHPLQYDITRQLLNSLCVQTTVVTASLNHLLGLPWIRQNRPRPPRTLAQISFWSCY